MKSNKTAKPMHECLTMPFVPGFSGCLVANPTCGFSMRCGLSNHCEHPNHQDFLPVNDLPVARADLPKLYLDLREARRLELQQEEEVVKRAAPSPRRPRLLKGLTESKAKTTGNRSCKSVV